MTLPDAELLRYSRHILMDEIGAEGQRRLNAARAVVVGLGGLGSAAAAYLCTSGLARLTLVDHDKVDLSNLQRQILHGTADIGRPKTESARDALQGLNPLVQLELSNDHVDERRMNELAADTDIVLDCSDNFATRYAINAACVSTGTTLISGSAIRWGGQVAVLPLAGGRGPCYACIYPPETRAADETCGESGVLAPLTGMVGSLQAAEAIRFLTGQPARACLFRFDALQGNCSRAELRRDPRCSVCR